MVAVIELGEDRYQPPVDPEPPRWSAARRVRTTTLALAGALVLGTGGAAPPAPPALHQIHRAPLSTGGHFVLTGDRLFATEPVIQGTARISAYELDSGQRLWTSAYRTDQRHLGLSMEAGLVLVLNGDWQNGPIRTTALDARTGQWRWSVPNQVTVLPGERVGLLIEDVFPAGSKVEPDDPRSAVPVHYISSGGGVYTTAPIGLMARVIDLDSAQELWTSPLSATATPVPATADRAAALVIGGRDGGLELRDPRTGAVRQRIDSADGAPQYAQATGDTLLVRYASNLTVYSADLRQRWWGRPLPADNPYVGLCGPMLCVQTATDVEVVDPATGASAWRTERPLFLQSHGAYLLEIDEQPKADRMVDPRTGRTLLDLSGWAEAHGFADDSPLLLLRRTGTALRTWVGLVDPGGTTVRPLDAVPYALSSCQVAPGVIACRTQQRDVRVWRYRAPPG